MNNGKNHMDHMLLPKATLMRFKEDIYNKISVLTFLPNGSCSIQECSPKNFHTRNNYYDKMVDDEVKKYETKIGEWNKRISDCVETNDFTQIDFDELKKFAIEIITLQFHRLVLVDDKLRNEFLHLKTDEYNKISSFYFSNGIKYSDQILNNIINFRRGAKDFEKYFQKNYLMNGNASIENMYTNFHAVILIIPEEIEATFLLPPQHYVGIDTTARVILAPRLAVGLYPDLYCDNVKKMTNDEVLALAPRSIECALEMSDPAYRQVVGGRTYLSQLKLRIDSYRNLIQKIDSTGKCKISVKENMLYDSLLECIMALKVLEPDAKEVELDFTFAADYKDVVNEWINKFKEYGYSVIETFI